MCSPARIAPLDHDHVPHYPSPPAFRRPACFSIAINIGPLPLAPGRTYEWRCSFDGEAHEAWTLPFSTRAPQPPPPR
jgi:hypothetical protein